MSDSLANLQAIVLLIFIGVVIAIAAPPLTGEKLFIAFISVGLLRLILRTKPAYSDPIEPPK